MEGCISAIYFEMYGAFGTVNVAAEFPIDKRK
jgi:hypothetical protein